MVFVRKLCGVLQTASLEHVPNLFGHFRFNGRTDEERAQLELLPGERFVNSIQRSAGSFPMLIRSCGVNAAFEFAKRDVSRWCADCFAGQFVEYDLSCEPS